MLGSPLPRDPAADQADIPSRDEVRAALARILAATPLARSERLRQFLAHVVERTLDGHAHELKETVLAVEVFDRPTTFDARTDSIVRLEARRLRERLAAYYEAEGVADPILIELPKGHYAARFSRRATTQVAAPGAVARTAGAADDVRQPSPRRFGVVGALTVLFALGVGGLLAWRWAGSERAPVIAILPFASDGADADLGRFAFGVVEDITTAVAGVPGVRVVARSSAFQYPERGLDVAVVGQALGATHVMEGSVRRQDDRVRITAQLIRVADAHHVWAETFDRRVGNAFDVQDAVAAAVAGAVSKALPGGTRPRQQRPPPSSAAYELYLEGVALRGDRTIGSLPLAQDRFERAVAADPQFAAAHAALGGVLAAIGFHEQGNSADALARARASVDRALALDEGLASAHATRAWITFFADWDLHNAEREFRRALTLNPSLADTHNLYALMLMAERRDDEALAQARAALDLDPLSFTRANDVGVVMLGTGHPRDALDHAYRAVRTSPTDRGARGLAAMSLAALHRYEGAAREFEVALGSGPRYTYLLGGLGYVRAKRGDRGGALALAREIAAACADGTGSWVHLAYIHAALGDERAALTDLGRAYDARDVDIVFLAAHPLLASLRAHPGFLALRARVLP